jgi:hypothetical protein
MNNETFFRLTTFLIFAVVGCFLARKLALPLRATEWVLWAFAISMMGVIGVNARMFDIRTPDTVYFTIYLNNLLQGLGVGVFVNFLLRHQQRIKAMTN